jgi:hypothetical protein
MTTHSFDLMFRGDPKSELAGPPTAYVCLKNYGSTGPENVPLITSDCVSIRELEHEVTRLHNELNQILAKAKRRYTDYDQRQREYLARKKASAS